ncbi:transcriptional regulator GutM [Heyndrickxia sporothermodurans]
MQMIIIMVFMAAAFLVQMLFGYLQLRHFTKVYTTMRRIGKVAIGKRPGKIRAGTIVFFAVTDSGKILKAQKMQGVTVLAKFRDLKGFTDKNIKNLQEKDMAHCNKLVRLAILDAVHNYKVIMSGGVIPEKHSLYKRMITKAESLATSKK